MGKEDILVQLRKSGFRVTSQRKMIIDIILSSEYSCCKEIYYQVHKKDPSIGMATVYRMIKILDETGLIDRKRQYSIVSDHVDNLCEGCALLEDHTYAPHLTPDEWKEVLMLGLEAKGYLQVKEDIAIAN
ncbi:MAG: Fur family transcriptional regulator [Lachnospiraceae bacterium]